MADTADTGAEPPSSKNKLVVLLTAIGAVLFAVSYVAGAFDKLYQTVCDNPSSCSLFHKAKEPVLPNFTSARVDGGHSFNEMCGPMLREYQNKYSDFKIFQHNITDDSHRDWKGHVTYQYTCSFTSAPL